MSRALLALLALALAAPAHAGSAITVYKKSLYPTFAWVDGQNLGKVKGKVIAPVGPGVHEVWIATEANGRLTMCQGLVDVADGETVSVASRPYDCQGLRPGYGPPGQTAFKGAELAIELHSEADFWFAYMDGDGPVRFPLLPPLLNLTPGTHTLALSNDGTKAGIFTQGTFAIPQGHRLRVACSNAGCVGFDQATEPIADPTAADDGAPPSAP